MANIWFTSDLHLMHPAIVNHCKRPISVEDHDQWLIERINQRVSKKDTLYILGDVSMTNRVNTERLVQQINGNKHLIAGNHDKNLKNCPVFKSVSQIKNVTFKIGKQELLFILCHYPIASWEDKVKGSYHLHGHTHNRFVNQGRTCDVGVDANDYYPRELTELITSINKMQK